MGLIVKSTGNKSKFPPMDAGSYAAICYAIIDIGEQFSEAFNKYSRKVVVLWEIPDELIDIDGEMLPRAISNTYTMSLSDKAILRQTLENWRGKAFTDQELKGFDLVNILGATCMLSIIHDTKSDGNVFAKIGGVSKLPKGMPAPQAVNEQVLFNLEDDGMEEKMKKLPEWIQKRIMESKTYQDMQMSGREGFVDVESNSPGPPF